MKPVELAEQFNFPLNTTYFKMTAEQKENVRRAMFGIGAKSINGVSGWFTSLRNRHRYTDVVNKLPGHFVRLQYIHRETNIEPVMCTELHEVEDVYKCSVG